MNNDPIKNWEASTSTGKHFAVLDGMRGIAILMVVFTHTFYINPKSGPFFHYFAGLVASGWMGVPIFFVLSGFLITYPFFRERAKDEQFWYLKDYSRRRIGKIIPPFYLSLIVMSVYYLIWFRDPMYLLAGLQWALGVPNFTVFTARAFSGPYWSLIVEIHFYLLVPLFFFVLRGLKPIHVALSIFAILWVVPFVVRQMTWPGDFALQDTILYYTRRFPCQLDFFAWGVLFAGGYVFWSDKRSKLRSLKFLGYAGLFLFAGTIFLDAYDFVRFPELYRETLGRIELFHFLAAVAPFLMLFFIFDPDCLGARFLSHPWLRFVGIVSYEWFLSHLPVVHLFRYLGGHAKGSLFMYLIITVLPLALTFLLSVVVYRYFSFPLLNWFRGGRSSRARLSAEM
jgi:peptidoglycan/LPS O-acetylase OafA/YrhL